REARASDSEPEIINYSGGYDRFYPIEGKHLLDPEKSFDRIKDKIVIVGYFGTTFNSKKSNNDTHFTPMNKNGGSGIRDMHGALIHANIVQMMIDKNYVNHFPKGNFWMICLSTLFAFPFVVLFTYYFVRRHLWYHIVAKITQLALGIVLIFIVLNLYDVFYIKLEIKFFLLILAISVDVLYLYEAIAAIIYKKYGKKSYFIHSH
ncbi:MAG: CHASE2 domain-containing protein, partial [Psychroserpens sp.]|nr:CHASE2 domain-containing protein [Psychroserpens sp.]